MKILVVDDSKVMRSIVRRTLRQAGFDSHTFAEATDGKNALEQMSEFQPDLVLSDWNMPEMSGLEFLHAVRADGVNTPFVFVTSEGTGDMRQLALAGGAQAVITKPFNADTFEQALSDFIN